MANELHTQVLKNDGRHCVIKVNHNGSGPEFLVTGGFIQGVVDGTGITGDGTAGGQPATTQMVTGFTNNTSDAANITKVFDDYPKRVKKIQYGHEDNTAYTTMSFKDTNHSTFEIFNLLIFILDGSVDAKSIIL